MEGMRYLFCEIQTVWVLHERDEIPVDVKSKRYGYFMEGMRYLFL
jgi:hypothetical protein